jgi:hypothetical protein
VPVPFSMQVGRTAQRSPLGSARDLSQIFFAALKFGISHR